MTLDFFDANVWVGRPMREPVFRPPTDAAELLAEMDRAGIRRALVWHITQHDDSPVVGNHLLAEMIAGEDKLRGCWTILPPQTDGLITPDFFQRMKEARVDALRACPGAHRYLLNRVVFGPFLDEVSDRRVPLLLSLQYGVTWPEVYQLLQEFPRLTCILCDIGTWSAERYLCPLLDAFENVVVETGMLALEDGGVENVVNRVGDRRLVFGTGFPERYAESAMLQLTHAAIAESAKGRIASGNLEQLLAGAEL